MYLGFGGPHGKPARWAATLCLLLVMLSVLAAPNEALAEPTTKNVGKNVGKIIGAGATVQKVEGKANRLRVHVDRGSATGLKIGSKGSFYAMRQAPGSNYASVDFDIRLATGRVVKLAPESAILSVEGAVADVAVGAFFEYQMTLPTALAESPLIRITALGVGLRPQQGTQSFATLGSLLANSSASHRDAVVDAMVADIHSIESIIASSMKSRVTEGRYHGMSPSEVVKSLDRAQLRDFLLFVEAFPGKYIAHQWALPEVFMTWVINGTPSGERDRLLRQVLPTIAAAQSAIKSRQFFSAKKLFIEVLRKIPDHEESKKMIESIDALQMLLRKLRSDPDDTSTRFAVVRELFDLGAYQQGLEQNEELKTRKYNPATTEKYRGYFLVKLERWREATAVFRKLAKEKPDDESLQQWNSYTIAMAAVAKSPGNPAAHFKLAQNREDAKNWDAARTQYRLALDSKRITPKQRQLAIEGQKRIATEQSIAKELKWIRDAIEQHKSGEARKRIHLILSEIDALKQSSRAGKVLTELADLAMSSENADLAIELFEDRKKRLPNELESYTGLAFSLQIFDRLDEAEAVMLKGLSLKGAKGYPYLILSDIARSRGDLAAVAKYAKLAIENSTNYPWPHINLARVEAAAGRWPAARHHAEEALKHNRDSWKIRDTYTAVLRGEDAHALLQADPTSPRNRLKLIRALADLGLAKYVANEIQQLPTTGTWREQAWWSLATSDDTQLLLSELLNAARKAKPTSPHRKRRLHLLEAQAKLRVNPNDRNAKLTLAQLYLEGDAFDKALAVAAPIVETTTDQAAEDLVQAARNGLTMDAQIDLANEARLRGDKDAALELSTRILRVAKLVGTLSVQARTQALRADALNMLGRSAEAIRLAKKVGELYVSDANVALIDLSRRHQAQYEATIGTRDTLHKALQSSLALCESLDDESCLYFVHNQLADLEGSEGRSASGIEHGRRAWKMADRLGRLDYARAARFALADANLAANHFSDAKRIAEDLLRDSRENEDTIHEQLSLMVLGEVEAMRGNGKLARSLFQEVYDLGTRNGNNDWRALARHFQGAAWLRADKNPAKAAEMLEESADLYRGLGDGWASSARTRVLRDLADAQLQIGKTLSARKTALESKKLALRFQHTPDLAFTEWILAMISVAEGKAEDAISHANTSIVHAKKTDSVDLLWRTYYAQALALQLSGKRTEALAAFETALDNVQRALEATGGDSEQAGYMSVGRVRQLYKDTIKLLLAMKRTRRAMEVLELSRDAQLRQVLDPANIETDDKVLKSKLATYKKTRARGVGLDAQLAASLEKPMQQQSAAQRKELGKRIGRNRQELQQVALGLKLSHRSIFQALVIAPQNLLDRRKELPAGAVVAEYFVTDEMLYVFVVSAGSDEPAVLQIPVSAQELNSKITAFREAIVSEPQDVESLGRQLNEWLLRPLRPHIANATTLIIMPFGPLYYVPFDALVVSEEGKALRYAVEDLRISIQTSDTLEQLLAKPARPKSGTMLAISNPDGSLPGAFREVKHIVKVAMPDAKVLDRKSATVKSFQDMAGAFRYLHLATHGVLSRDASKTHLTMADGPLSVLQIAGLKGLKQNNDLVVLSACNTAMEKDHTSGDALVSLASGFALAGAPTLLASLWEVPDASTPELMATFYRFIEEGSGDKLDALRTAKLNLLRAQRGARRPFAAPWHWASFQLYGDFRSQGSVEK